MAAAKPRTPRISRISGEQDYRSSHARPGTLNSTKSAPPPTGVVGGGDRRVYRAGDGDPITIVVVESIRVSLSGVPVFASGARLHAVRVATFDRAVRRFLGLHPAGVLVALGEGLETQFWRLDNGHVRWLTVEVPEVIELRRRVLPDGPRQSSHSGSALDRSWLDRLDPADPILVTAQGLFPYFQRDQVHRLIAGIAERLPGSRLVFDVVPKAMLGLVRRTSGRERDLAVELWTWLFDAHERAAISTIPDVEDLRDLIPPRAIGLVSYGTAAIARLPRNVRYSLPVIPALEARFGA
jgi:leucine carboxyl methyltransferase